METKGQEIYRDSASIWLRVIIRAVYAVLFVLGSLVFIGATENMPLYFEAALPILYVLGVFLWRYKCLPITFYENGMTYPVFRWLYATTRYIPWSEIDSINLVGHNVAGPTEGVYIDSPAYNVAGPVINYELLVHTKDGRKIRRMLEKTKLFKNELHPDKGIDTGTLFMESLSPALERFGLHLRQESP
jgi:hypothetical protein